MKFLSDKKIHEGGFTLFGLLLYITLAAVVLTALGELTMGVLVLSARADRVRSGAYTLLFLRTKLADELGHAESISAPSPGNPSSTLSFMSGGEAITYSLGEGRLWVSQNASDPIALTPQDVVIVESIFETSTSSAPQNPIRWTVQTATRDPLRVDEIHLHATTTFTWYPYVYN